MTRQTHTVVTLEIPRYSYDFIADKMTAAGYEHAFMHSSDGPGIDMSGVAVVPEPITSDMDEVALGLAREYTERIVRVAEYQCISTMQVAITRGMLAARAFYPNSNVIQALGLQTGASETSVLLALSVVIEKAKKFDMFKEALKG